MTCRAIRSSDRVQRIHAEPALAVFDSLATFESNEQIRDAATPPTAKRIRFALLIPRTEHEGGSIRSGGGNQFRQIIRRVLTIGIDGDDVCKPFRRANGEAGVKRRRFPSIRFVRQDRSIVAARFPFRQHASGVIGRAVVDDENRNGKWRELFQHFTERAGVVECRRDDCRAERG